MDEAFGAALRPAQERGLHAGDPEPSAQTRAQGSAGTPHLKPAETGVEARDREVERRRQADARGAHEVVGQGNAGLLAEEIEQADLLEQPESILRVAETGGDGGLLVVIG